MNGRKGKKGKKEGATIERKKTKLFFRGKRSQQASAVLVQNCGLGVCCRTKQTDEVG
jgi:hypothetical protein